MTDTEDKTPRLLAMLEGELLPSVRGRKAYKRPPQPPETVLRQVRTPAWKWHYTGADLASMLGQKLVTVDANAAYLSAASSVVVARDGLRHTGPWVKYERHPGFYQLMVDEDAWQDLRLVSPLGTADYRPVIWLSEPTVTLLQELVRADMWPALVIIDSWTSPEGARMTKWTDHLRELRADLILGGTTSEYDRFKLAYSQAVQMLKGSPLCMICRPDWYHAIHAQHTANIWRKAWKTALAGCGPVSAGSVDALTYTEDAFMRTQQAQPPLLRLDQSGLSFGTFKVVR